MIFGIRTFIRGVSGNAAGGQKAAVSHGALFDSETGLLKIMKSYEWNDPIDPTKATMYIGDFDPRGIAVLDHKFSLDDIPKAIDAFMELEATERLVISDDLPPDINPKDVIYVQGFKTSGKGADILVTEMVSQAHVSVLALCLFSKSIQDSADFVEGLDIIAGNDDDSDDEDDIGMSGLSVQSISFGFGGRLH